MSQSRPGTGRANGGLTTAAASKWIGVVAGLAGAISFQPLHWAALMPLAPLGLFLAARSVGTPRRAFLRVLAGAFIFYFGAIHWLCSLYLFNFMAPAGIAFVGFYMALYPAAGAYAMRRWLGYIGMWQQFAAWSAWWLLFEWFRTLGRLSMPFTLISHAWANWPPLIQFAACAGEIGVSLQILVLGGGLLAAWVVFVPVKSKWRAITGISDDTLLPGGAQRLARVAAGVLLGISVVGAGASIARFTRVNGQLAEAPEDKRLSVLVLQPNIDQYTKMASYMADDAVLRARLQEMTNQLHEKLVGGAPAGIDLIVMPETTFSSFDFVGDYGLHRRIEAMLQPTGADVFFGADRVLFDDMGEPVEIYNSSYFVPQGSTIREAKNQDKMRLVPFGEHLPYFDMIPFFNDTLVKIASFDEGKQITIFDSHGAKFGALICFESTFGLQARRITASGANFLCVITNDAWYRWSEGDGPHWSAGPSQHHALSIMRAIETGRPVIRAANTGISSIIAPNGRITAGLALGERGIFQDEIVPQEGLTPYVRYGNTPLVLVCLLALTLIFIGTRRSAQNHQDRPGRT